MHPGLAIPRSTVTVFGRVRPVSLAVVGSMIVAHILLKGVFFSAWFLHEIAEPIEAWSGGVILPATAAGLIQLMLLVGVGILLLGRLAPSHIGLRTTGLRKLLPVVLAIWVLGHLICLALGATPSRGVQSYAVLLGNFLEATAGSALPEELFFRGFLLVQLFLFLGRRNVAWTPTRCLVVSMVAVQLYFAASHIPAAGRAGLPLETAMLWLLQAALVGGMLSVLFIQTGNIAMAVAGHALINMSLPILESPVQPQLVLLVLVCVTMLVGTRLFGRVLSPVT